MDGEDNNYSPSRRRILGLVAGSTLLPGCNDTPTKIASSPTTPTRAGSSPPPGTPTKASAAITVEQIHFDPIPVGQTRPLSISITAANNGHQPATRSFTVTIDGKPIDKLTFELAPGTRKKRPITTTIARVGSHKLSVGTESASITVTRYPNHFVKRNGPQFVLDNATAFFNGVHIDHHPLIAPHLIDEELSDAARMGCNVVAVHAFETGSWIRGKFGPREGERFSFHPQPRTFHEPTFKLLDHLIYRAKQLDIRVVLELGNNYSHHGGIPKYVEWSSTADTHDDFFTNTEANDLYRAYVRTVLTRTNTITGLEYRNDPTIMLWIPIKEVRNTSPGNRDIVTQWIKETTAFFKRLDPNHLVSPGEEGGYRRENIPEPFLEHGFGHARGSYLVDNRQSNVDACGFNFYPDYVNDGPRSLTLEGGRTLVEGENDDIWFREHIEDAHQSLGKPAFVREFNDGQLLDRGGENQEETLELRNKVLDSWYTLFDTLDLNGAILYGFAPDELIDFAMDAGVPMKDGVKYEDKSTRSVIMAYSRRVREKSEHDFGTGMSR